MWSNVMHNSLRSWSPVKASFYGIRKMLTNKRSLTLSLYFIITDMLTIPFCVLFFK